MRRKVPNRVIYSLWLIVAVRLMIPFGLPESAVSIMNFGKYTENEIKYTIPEKNEPPDIVIKNPEPERSTANNKAVPHIVKSNKKDVYSMLSVIHIIVTCMILVWFLIVNIMFYIKLRRNRVKYETECIIPVYVVEDLNSPCIFGIFRPSVYLNKSASLQTDSLDYIISHELFHYKHGDLIWSLLRCILVSVWWFNPLVWIGAYLSKQDCECACDESVMKNFRPEQRIEYGRVLISLVNSERPEIIGNISTSMTSGGKRLKERIILITKKPVNSVKLQIFMIIVILMATVCTFTSAKTAHETDIPAKNNIHTDIHIREPTESENLPEKTNETTDSVNHIVTDTVNDTVTDSLTESEIIQYKDIAIEVYYYAKMVYSRMLKGGNYCQTNGNIYCSNDDVLYDEVSDSEISSIEDLKKTVRRYFSESLASEYDNMIEEHYIEFDGKLYQHTSDKNAGNAEYFSVNFLAKDNKDTFYFEAEHYDPYAEEKTIIYYQPFSMTYENGTWKINTFNP